MHKKQLCKIWAEYIYFFTKDKGLVKQKWFIDDWIEVNLELLEK